MVDTGCVMVVGETCVRSCIFLLFLSDVFMESLCSYVATSWYDRSLWKLYTMLDETVYMYLQRSFHERDVRQAWAVRLVNQDFGFS